MTWYTRLIMFFVMLMCFATVSFVVYDLFIAPLPAPPAQGVESFRRFCLTTIEVVTGGVALVVGLFLLMLIVVAEEAQIGPVEFRRIVSVNAESDEVSVTTTTVTKETTTCPGAKPQPTP